MWPLFFCKSVYNTVVRKEAELWKVTTFPLKQWGTQATDPQRIPLCHKSASHLTMSNSESHTLTHFSRCSLLNLHNKNPVTDTKNICRKTRVAELRRYVNRKAYLGTSESPPLNVVGSNSKMDEISFPSGTDTRVYMTLSWAFRKRARKISCSESSWKETVKTRVTRKNITYF